ncbi:MAG: zinc ABC transporter substrate-binding protein [Lachnospiraceae bacterium]|nr:zinc ABC transporter substrate-binding protein [Lachnospiraceae bacterium]
MIKRIVTLLLTALLTAGCLCACGGKPDAAAGEGKLNIVTTIFPEYDWVLNILGDEAANVDVTLLLDNGVDLHSYQPTTEDILKISTCDLFIYVGGESDAWVDAALQEAVNKDMVVINLLDVLGSSVKEEEVIEGMQPEEEEHEDGEEAEEEEPEYDEHVWLSLRNASALTQSIADALKKTDPAHADAYQSNAAAYVSKLQALDQDYQAAVDAAPLHTLVFGDRFPFRYLTDDYHLDYYAAFVGCSAETEASFETITFLAQKVDELGLPAVMTIEGDNHRIAETVVENTKTKDQEILTMDSMQSATAKDIANGANYLSIMKNNLSVMKEALQSDGEEIAADNRQTGVDENAPEPESIDGSETAVSTTDGIDVDLTTLSSTMVYAEVYNMMVQPEDYTGKTVKMDGLFSSYHDEQTGKDYFACTIMDATACCSQGIEFVLTDDYVYPDDYPEEGGEICVCGVFDTYQEGDYTYCTLRDATLA